MSSRSFDHAIDVVAHFLTGDEKELQVYLQRAQQVRGARVTTLRSNIVPLMTVLKGLTTLGNATHPGLERALRRAFIARGSLWRSAFPNWSAFRSCGGFMTPQQQQSVRTLGDAFWPVPAARVPSEPEPETPATEPEPESEEEQVQVPATTTSEVHSNEPEPESEEEQVQVPATTTSETPGDFFSVLFKKPSTSYREYRLIDFGKWEPVPENPVKVESGAATQSKTSVLTSIVRAPVYEFRISNQPMNKHM